MPAPRRFLLVRRVDPTGVSGTGVVAEGIVWTDGTAALRWRTSTASTAVYASVADVERIHGHGGATRLEWLDPAGPLPPQTVSTGVFPLPRPYAVPPGTSRRESGAHRA